ncbi:MAG: hypothetical protein IPJ20_19235 [Flammeovirgaceae bacterium]|nr:hypothetical protein [Flammeovirgaceae bacterium]
MENFGTRLDWGQYAALIEMEPQVQEIKTLIEQGISLPLFSKAWCPSKMRKPVRSGCRTLKKSMSCFTDIGPTSLRLSIENTLQSILPSMKAAQSLIGLVRWELFSKD